MDQKFRQDIRKVNLNKLSEQFRGTQYRKLVEKHMREIGARLDLASVGSVEAFTDLERSAAEVLIDDYNSMGYNQLFWVRDTSEVFEEVCDRSRALLAQFQAPCEDKILFNMFQLVTMNLAVQARDQKELRKFAGIKRSTLIR